MRDDTAESKAQGTVQVMSPGPLAMLQDNGRTGYQHLGVGVGGVADSHAAGWANRLLGNASDAVLVEIFLGNFRVRFDCASEFSVAGAEVQWRLDGRPISNWQSHRAQSGSLLEASMASAGLRAYLAFPGGVDAPGICGSSATSVGEGLGGLLGNGSPLKQGDVLKFSPRQAAAGVIRRVPTQFCRVYGNAMRLRVVPSNQFNKFPPASVQQFFASRFQVAAESDRMGVRLQGRPLENPPESLTSEAVSSGAIQVPASGLPIVLMQDCQTIGGYPKLGHVYRVDLDLLAQARSGVEVQFSLGDAAESRHELLLQKQFFCRYRERNYG